jgi:AcrR family transcriptional regulator
MATRTRRSAEISRETWLNAAYAVLEQEGVDRIRIERLGRLLGLSKGSFYGQFANRDALLDALLAHWRSEMLRYVAVARAHLTADPLDNLAFVLRLVDRNALLKYDSAVRVWARADKAVAAVVREIDEARMAYLRDVFAVGDLTGPDIAARSEAFYGYTMYLATAKPGPYSAKDWALFQDIVQWVARR